MKPDLEAIRARAEKATVGPWTSTQATLKGNIYFVEDGNGEEVGMGGYGGEVFFGEEDAAFIAHSRADIPSLLAYIDSLERVREAAAVGHTDDDGVICGQYPQSRFPCRMCDALAAVEEK